MAPWFPVISASDTPMQRLFLSEITAMRLSPPLPWQHPISNDRTIFVVIRIQIRYRSGSTNPPRSIAVIGMTPHPSRVWLAQSPWLAIIAAMVLGPSLAHASCGDYLVHRDAAPMTATHSTEQSDPATDAPEQPCHGPQCQRSQPEAPVAPSVPSRPVEDFWPCSCAGPGGNDALTSPIAFPPSPLPIRRESSIFHPPRPTS
jgi:hypothetical protein